MGGGALPASASPGLLLLLLRCPQSGRTATQLFSPCCCQCQHARPRAPPLAAVAPLEGEGWLPPSPHAAQCGSGPVLPPECGPTWPVWPQPLGALLEFAAPGVMSRSSVSGVTCCCHQQVDLQPRELARPLHCHWGGPARARVRREKPRRCPAAGTWRVRARPHHCHWRGAARTRGRR